MPAEKQRPYECPRCMYNTRHLALIRKHFNRKKLCPAIVEDMELSKVVKEYVFINRVYKQQRADSDDENNPLPVGTASTPETLYTHMKHQYRMYDELPDFIYISGCKKLMDDNNEPINIQMCGRLTYSEVWFKASDIVRMLPIKCTFQIFDDSALNLKDPQDFKTFKTSVTRPDEGQYWRYDKYLSYAGLVRVLYGTQQPIANKMVKWVNELFVSCHNTQEPEVPAEILGISIKTLHEFSKTSVQPISCIYLLALGKVKNLREAFGINDMFRDDDVVYKYGMTKNLRRRVEQHDSILESISGVQVALKHHVHIDPLYLSAAESSIEQFFKKSAWHTNHPLHTEIVCIPNECVDTVVRFELQRLGETYANKTKSQNQVIVDLREQMVKSEYLFKDVEASKNKLIAELEAHLRDKEEMLQLWKLD